MRMLYFGRFECDGCGKIAHITEPAPEWRQPRPAGWGLPEDYILRLPDGRHVQDFCEDCMVLPLEKMIARSAEMAGRREQAR